MKRHIFSLLLGVLSCGVAPVISQAAEDAAAPETGNVAAMQGSLKAQRDGTFSDIAQGSSLHEGDRIKTGPGDQAKLVFVDDSVIDMAPSTELVLETQKLDAVANKYETTLRLVSGKLRVALGDNYLQQQNRFEVETPTAVALRGTEYIVSYSATNEVSEIVVGTGQVDVVGKLAVVGGGVQVGPQMRTEVRKGKFPTAAAKVGPERMEQYRVGLNIVGTGRRDGLNVLHPVVTGKLAAAQDVPGAKAPTALTADGRLKVGTPPESLGEQLSADVRTNTQPLLEYRRKQAGVPLPPTTGGVVVDF